MSPELLPLTPFTPKTLIMGNTPKDSRKGFEFDPSKTKLVGIQFFDQHGNKTTFVENKTNFMNTQDNSSREAFQWNDQTVKDFIHFTFAPNRSEHSEIDTFMHNFKSCRSKEKEQDWEIVEFVGSKNSIFNHKCHDGALPNRDKWEALFLKENYPIHSVRRKSDNSTWTVGDETNYGRIEKIVRGTFDKPLFQCKGIPYYISQLSKQEQRVPLFTTEDGKEIFGNNDYWKVYDDFTIAGYNSTPGGDYTVEFTKQTFSTEQAARNFIIQHKPFMSIQDVMNRLNAYLQPNLITEAHENLKHFAQSKIK